MFTFVKLAVQVLLKSHKLTDKDSCKKFAIELISLVKPLALTTKTNLDNDFLSHLEYVIANDVLFAYVYSLIRDQFSTDETVFESVNEDVILELCDNTAVSGENLPEAINPVVIISLVSQIISIINAIKSNK